MRNEGGEIKTDPEEIKGIYKEFYKRLFEKPKREEKEKEVETEVNKKIEEIKVRAKTQDQLKVTQRGITEVIRNLKRKKAKDNEGWINELIIEGGEEMNKSLEIMFNRILRDLEIPKKWEEMKIKSIYKNQGSNMDMKNRRGIFLTSVIGKVFEKTVLAIIRESIDLGECQNGGRKERSTKDNWLGMMAVMDRNKWLKKETCFIFADAEKCFDKLWLEDCLVDMKKCGMREREIVLLMEMNKEARFSIITLYGETEKVKINRIVKQGTIFGPLLCCGNTKEINNIGDRATSTYITAKKEIGALIYVDDIGIAGSKETIMQAGNNLAAMEKKKGYTFNVQKTSILRMNREKNAEKINIQLKKGQIEEVKKYKFLGNWMDEKGSMEEQINEIEKRAEGMIVEMMKMTREEDLGKMSTEARLIIYQRTAVPTITNNLECWTIINKQEMERLEKIQGRILKRLLWLPGTTPYWGVLKETGIWTIEMQVLYQRMMLYQCLVTADDERLGKKVIVAQEEDGCPGWASETKGLARRIGIGTETAKEKAKSTWRKEVKEKIEKELERQFRGKESKKLRHMDGQKFKRKEYLREMRVKEASRTMKRRTEMIDMGNNLGGKRKCECGEKEEVEHIISCKEVKGHGKVKEEWLRETEKIDIIRKVNQWIEEYMDRREGKNKEQRKIKHEE